MRSTATGGAGRSTATALRAAGSNPLERGRRGWTALRRVIGPLGRLVRRLVARRRRPRLDGWMTMDPRLLADIGVSRTDLQAVLYAGSPIEGLGARRVSPSAGEVVSGPRRPAPCLRLVEPEHLDAAA